MYKKDFYNLNDAITLVLIFEIIKNHHMVSLYGGEYVYYYNDFDFLKTFLQSDIECSKIKKFNMIVNSDLKAHIDTSMIRVKSILNIETIRISSSNEYLNNEKLLNTFNETNTHYNYNNNRFANVSKIKSVVDSEFGNNASINYVDYFLEQYKIFYNIDSIEDIINNIFNNNSGYDIAKVKNIITNSIDVNNGKVIINYNERLLIYINNNVKNIINKICDITKGKSIPYKNDYYCIPATNCIYKYTNKINGKSYIGRTVNNMNRQVNRFNSPEIPFEHIVNKIGLDKFNFKIIESNIQTMDEMKEREKFYIKKYKTIKNGYNIKIQ